MFPQTSVGRLHRLYERTFQRSFKLAVVAANITRPVIPRIRFHAFATQLVQSSCDIRMIQELLVHADIATRTLERA
ncbi:tyrosine-type recombinase/integrase [Roseateles sp. GG27B]